MKKRKLSFFLLLVLILPAIAQEQKKPARFTSANYDNQVLSLEEIFRRQEPVLEDKQRTILRLSLQDCIHRALAHNYDIRIGAYNPAIRLADVVQAEAAFDALLYGSAQFDFKDQANLDSRFYTKTTVTNNGTSETRIPTDPFDNTHEYNYVVGLRKQLPTGTTIQLSQALRRFRDLNNEDILYQDPFYQFGLQLEIRQPLLRDFGIDVNRASIIAARNNFRISQQQFELQVIKTAADIETNYWQLFLMRQRVKIYRERIKRSSISLERILQRQNLDSSSLIISRTRADIKRTQADLVAARSDLLHQQDLLLQKLNDPELPLEKLWEIITIDKPRTDLYQIERRKAVEIALKKRPEIIAQALRVDTAHLAEDVSQNQLLPRLDLTYRQEITGPGDQYHQAWDKQWQNDTVNHLFGLSFEMPLGNRAAEAANLQSRRQRQQEELRLKSIREQILTDLSIAENNLDNSYKEITARQQAVNADRNEYLNYLAMEETQRSDIMTPNFINLKLNSDEQLAISQIRAVQTMVQYNIALMDIHRAQGTLLRYNNIKLEEMPQEP